MAILKIYDEATKSWQEIVAFKGDKGDKGDKGEDGLKAPVVQTTGDSTTSVMSQKAVSEAIASGAVETESDSLWLVPLLTENTSSSIVSFVKSNGVAATFKNGKTLLPVSEQIVLGAMSNQWNTDSTNASCKEVVVLCRNAVLANVLNSNTRLTKATFIGSANISMADAMIACASLTYLDVKRCNLANVTSFSQMCMDCKSLKKIDFGYQDFSKCTAFASFLGNCTSLTDVRGAFENIKADIGLNYAPLTRESALVFINGLYDFSAEGGTHTIYLSSTTKALLTDADRTLCTSKGWTIA